MKLHLPSRLRSALLACMALISPVAPSVSGVALTAGVAAFALCQVEASVLTSETTTVGNVTYSGYVIEYVGDESTGLLHAARFKGDLVTGSNTKYKGSAVSDSPKSLGITSYSDGTNAKVDKYMDGTGEYDEQNLYYLFVQDTGTGHTHGHTLKLNSPATGADITLKCSFAPITLGGLITTTTGSTNSYTIESTNSGGTAAQARDFILVAGSCGLKMDIGVNTTLKSNGGKMEVQSGGTWKIASGKSLTLNSGTGDLSFAKDQTVGVVGDGTLVLCGGSITNSGTLNLGSKLSINRAITNTGTINAAAGGTLISIDDLSAFTREDGSTLSDGVNGYVAKSTVEIFSSGGTLSGVFKASHRGGTEAVITGGSVTLDLNGGLYYINKGDVVTSTYGTAQKATGFLFEGEKTSLTIDSERSDSWGNIEMKSKECSLVFAKDAIVGTLSTTTSNSSSRNITVNSGVAVEMEAINNNWGMGTLTVNGKLTVVGTLTMSSGAVEQRITGSGVIGADIFKFGNAGTYNVDVAELKVSKIYNSFRGSTLNITGGCVTTETIELADNKDGATCKVNVLNGACLRVTGGDTNDTNSYKTTGIMFSEWQSTSEITINGTMIAEYASVQSGDRGFTLTVGETGTLLTKGVGAFTTSGMAVTTTSTLTLQDGGRLILGTNAFNSTSTTATINVVLNGGTIGAYVGEMAINKSLSVLNGKVVTIDSSRYYVDGNEVKKGDELSRITINGGLSVDGTLNITGAGSVTLSTLTGTGKMLVNGGTTEVTSALTGTTAVEVTGGTLTLAGGTAAGSGSVTVKDGGTLSLKGGADVAVETSFASDTVTLEKGGVLTCSGKTTLTGTVTGSGTLTVAGGSELTVSGTVSLGATITNAGKLSLGTGGSLSFSSLAELNSKGTSYYDAVMRSESVNGYESGTYYIVKGSGTIDSLPTVSVDGANFDVTVEGGNATIINSGKSGLYYINTGTVNYGGKDEKGDPLNAAASDDTIGLVLKGGTLNMYSSLNEKAERGIIVAGKASILLCEGGSLEDVALTVEKKDGVQLKLQSSDGGSVTLKQLTGEGELVEGSDVVVKEGGSFTGTYSGAVRFGTAADGALQKLCADDNLTVIGTAGTVEVTGLNNAAAADNVLGGIDTTGASVKLNNKTDADAPTKVTLVNASSMNGGETGCELEFTVSAAQVNANLAADKADKPTVITGKKLDLTNVTLKVNEVDNMGFAYNTDGPEKDIILFVVSDNAGSTVNNVTVDMSGCSWMSKYFTNFRVVEGSVNVVADANTGIYASHGQTPNGTAGLALAGKAMFHVDPQTQNPGSELAQVLDMLDNYIASGNNGAMDKLGAALAGSSLSAVGMAVSDDVQRQLRSIRNRTTTMGVNECVVNEDMPYVNGWISGDGNYRQFSESGTDAGYQVSSWGGTVGVDVDVNPNLTLGVAVSALFGDYTGKAADTLTGDLDTQYVSLFARVSTGSWVNTFVGTLGRADVDLERTIPGIAGKTTYKTDGMMFGFLYEVARTFALNEDASTCVQPLFNMSFTTEGGTADTRLTTDSASLTQFSLGLGGRLQSVVGENEYNRASIFEARALLKLDLGDRYNKLNTALAALPTATVSTRSNEKGVIGAEVGASLTIPISQDAGSVFFDVNADFRADQTGVNGSVGYRVNF